MITADSAVRAWLSAVPTRRLASGEVAT